jgi:S1-C subfamily serine protease
MHQKTILLFLLFTFSTLAFGQNNDESCNTGTPFLGINFAKLSSEKANLLGFNNPYGDYVTKVIKNTAADKGGIQIFDYIYGMDDFRAGKDKKMGYVFKNYKPGDKAVVHYYRKGRPLSTEIVFGDKGDVKEESKSHVFFGVSQHNGYEADSKGVKINVINNSTAKEMGLKDGDLILSINTYPMITWSDISTAMEAMLPGEKIKVTYERAGQKMKGALPIKSPGETKNYTKVKPAKKVKPYLGLQYDNLSIEKARKLGFEDHNGIYITKIYEKTAADRAGLLVFDYLYGVDEYVIGKEQPLGLIMQKYAAGDEAVLSVLRDGGKVKLDVVFGMASDKKVEVSDKCKKPFFGIVQINSKDKLEGVMVDIVPNSTAKAMGMTKGNVILSINNHNTYDWTDITVAIYQLKVGQEISVVYLQDGKKVKKSRPIKSYCDTKDIEDHGRIEASGDESGSWTEVAPGLLEEGETVDINNVNLMISDISTEEAGLMQYATSTSNLKVDYLAISPHPASGKFLLEFTLPGNGDLGVRLHNGAGREIYSYEMSGFTGAFSDTVNISQNGTGNYFIEIKHGDKHLSKKITLAAM